MVGAAVGTLQHRFFPASPARWALALVGMGTLFAGFLRVPMTSVFMVLEVSGNYSIILPVMISNTIAYLISRRFQQAPIFDIITRQDGLDLPSMEEGASRLRCGWSNHAQTAWAVLSPRYRGRSRSRIRTGTRTRYWSPTRPGAGRW